MAALRQHSARVATAPLRPRTTPATTSSVDKYPGGFGGLAPRFAPMTKPTNPNRLLPIDMARTLALLGMVAFHLRFDLVIFGLLPPETTATPFFYWHARVVAGSFLFLAGLSLWLAHGRGLIWTGFLARLLRLIAAAALVSVATYIALPQAWIFFGILHSIALCSVLALPFLRAPAIVTLAAGAAVIAAAQILPEILQWNAPLLRWVGLQTLPTETMDMEPVFPWFGMLLLGLGTGRALNRIWPRLRMRATPLARALAWPGQHSLAIYLLHQPVLLALVWTYVQLT